MKPKNGAGIVIFMSLLRRDDLIEEIAQKLTVINILIIGGSQY